LGDAEATSYECDPTPYEMYEIGDDALGNIEATCTQINGPSAGQQFSCTVTVLDGAFSTLEADSQCDPTPAPAVPTAKEECRDGGFEDFAALGFKIRTRGLSREDTPRLSR
jgi:hypothetical protein